MLVMLYNTGLGALTDVGHAGLHLLCEPKLRFHSMFCCDTVRAQVCTDSIQACCSVQDRCDAHVRGAITLKAKLPLPSRPCQRCALSALELLVCGTLCGPASMCCFTQARCRHVQGFRAKVDAWNWGAEEHATQSQGPGAADESGFHVGPQEQQTAAVPQQQPAGQWQPGDEGLAQLPPDAGPEMQWPQGEAWSSDGGYGFSSCPAECFMGQYRCWATSQEGQAFSLYIQSWLHRSPHVPLSRLGTLRQRCIARARRAHVPVCYRLLQAVHMASQLQVLRNARLPRSAQWLLPLPAGSAHGLDEGPGPAQHSQDSPIEGTVPLGTLRHHFSRHVSREPSLSPAFAQHQRQEVQEATSDDEWAGGQSDTAARCQANPPSAPAGYQGSSAASAKQAGPLQQPVAPSTAAAAAAASSRQLGGEQRQEAPASAATSPQHQLQGAQQQQQAEGGQGSSTRRADVLDPGHYVLRSAGPSVAGSFTIKRGSDALQQRQHHSQQHDVQRRQQQLLAEQADRPADQLMGMLRRLEATLSMEEPATIQAADADEQQLMDPAGRVHVRRTSSADAAAGQAPTAMAVALATSLSASRKMASRMADFASAAKSNFAARQ